MLPHLLLIASSLDAQGLTPCQRCCAPGGDCSKAYKGMPGKCCGEIGGQSFCCPGISFRGLTSGDGKCYNCGESYRCFSSAVAGNVCGAPSWMLSRRPTRYSEAGSGGHRKQSGNRFCSHVSNLSCGIALMPEYATRNAGARLNQS